MTPSILPNQNHDPFDPSVNIPLHPPKQFDRNVKKKEE